RRISTQADLRTAVGRDLGGKVSREPKFLLAVVSRACTDVDWIGKSVSLESSNIVSDNTREEYVPAGMNCHRGWDLQHVFASVLSSEGEGAVVVECEYKTAMRDIGDNRIF